jgi:heterodisulfide reductase subunit C
MPTPSATHRFDEDFLKEVQQGSEQNLTRCYQCGNCTAGCPLSFAYDIPVNRLMRLLQAGEKHAVLSSKAIWLCASCETCTTRCPNEIDVARIMDVLRHMARREGLVAEPSVRHMWDAFLSSVEKYGRVFEAGMMANFAPAGSGPMPTLLLLPLARASWGCVRMASNIRMKCSVFSPASGISAREAP